MAAGNVPAGSYAPIVVGKGGGIKRWYTQPPVLLLLSSWAGVLHRWKPPRHSAAVAKPSQRWS